MVGGGRGEGEGVEGEGTCHPAAVAVVRGVHDRTAHLQVRGVVDLAGAILPHRPAEIAGRVDARIGEGAGEEATVHHLLAVVAGVRFHHGLVLIHVVDHRVGRTRMRGKEGGLQSPLLPQ